MSLETQVWILTGVVSGLFSILILLVKFSFKRLVARLESLIDQVGKLTNTVSVQKTELDHLTEKNQEQDTRINKHSERIRHLEIKISKHG